MTDLRIFIFMGFNIFLKNSPSTISTILLSSKTVPALDCHHLKTVGHWCSLASKCKMKPLSLLASANWKAAWPGNPHYTVGGSHVGPSNMSAAEWLPVHFWAASSSSSTISSFTGQLRHLQCPRWHSQTWCGHISSITSCNASHEPFGDSLWYDIQFNMQR